MRTTIFGLTLLGFSLVLTACVTSGSAGVDEPSVPQIIYDTDFGGDADDLGALVMLHKYADEGAIDLLAVTSWTNEEYAIPAIAAVNAYYGRPDLALGVREVSTWRTDWNYTKALHDAFPHPPETVAETRGAVALYRELLHAADPHSITIVTVGPLANIANLLASSPDEISHLTGAQLVRRKVDKFVIMGGQFPSGATENGPEWNFDGNMPGITQRVLERLDRPVVFSGYEVGEAIGVGEILNQHPVDTPIYVGYKYFSEHAPWMKANYQGAILDNASFDQTAVIYAAIGGEGRFWSLSEPGRLSADETGAATWTEDPEGVHRYLILEPDLDDIENYIAEAMTYQPQ